MRVLSVLSGIMSARVTIPILTELKKKGVETPIIAEGRAVVVCKEKGWPLIVEGDDELKPYEVERARKDLRRIKPDVALVGTGLCPSNWEKRFAWVAGKELGLPVVAVEDIWGGVTRLEGFVPDWAFVMDEFSAKKIMMGSDGFKYPPIVIGDIASITDTKISGTDRTNHDSKEAGLIATLSKYTLVLIVGDHLNNVLELVKIVAESIKLENHPDEFVVVPRLVHPKLVNDPNVTPILEEAKRLFKGLEVYHFDGISTDALAARCDYTATCFSTPLRIALHHGKRAISVQGPKSNKLMKDETGFDEYPLVTAGAVPALVEPARITEFDWKKYSPIARQWAEQAKFRPEEAVEVILSLVK